MKPLWVMVAGPYRSGTSTESERVRNLRELNRVAYEVSRRGHVPIVAVNLALPIIEAAGPERYEKIMMPLSLSIAERCDAILRVGGVSTGADQEVEIVRARGGAVYRSLAELPSRLTTARLTLRPLGVQDAEPVANFWASPGVRRFLFDDEILPAGRVRSMIETNERLCATEGFGLWGAWTSHAPSFIGFGGFWHFRDPPELELVYGVGDDYCGAGYATEIARAVVTFGFDVLGMRSIRASTDEGNHASVHVLDKLGFQFLRRATIAGRETLFYELNATGE
jgi:RimJ/RimL family protein N-acetyltransferase